MRNHCCVSVVNKCFLALYCVEFGTNSEVTTLPCINKPVYELIVQIKRPLVFLGYLFSEKKTFSSLLFLLVCLFFLAKQITSMYSTFSIKKRKKENEVGVWGEQGNRVLLCGHEWLGTCCIDQAVLELMGDPASTCHDAQLMYFWSDNKVAWIPSGFWGTWQW